MHVSSMFDRGHDSRDVRELPPSLEAARRARLPADRVARWEEPVVGRGSVDDSKGRGSTPAPERGGVAAAFERALNSGTALVLLLLASPLLVAIAILILVVDGRPVFFIGPRLGLGKRRFSMIKFRTLGNGATSVLGADLVPNVHSLAIPFGDFLRETRLDELPQLLDIVRGKMNLFGPRPVRPEIYDRFCRRIAGYDARFRVKPGLIGFSQLFTPHCAPKRLRASLDNRAVRRRSFLRDATFVGYTGLVVALTTTTRILRLTGAFVSTRCLGRRRDRRASERRSPRAATVRVVPRATDGGSRSNGTGAWSPGPCHSLVADINGEALRFSAPEKLPETISVDLSLEIRFRRRFGDRGRRTRTARCSGEVVVTRRTVDGWDHVVRYEPASESSRYVIAQYLLGRSLARPFVE